jgi:DNA-binding IclR family transcriptional regulator
MKRRTPITDQLADPKPSPSPMIDSVSDAITLIEILADPFQPRRIRDLVAIAQDRGLPWSQTKIYNLLFTLKTRGWIEEHDDYHFLSPKLLNLILRFNDYIRSQAENLHALIDQVHDSATGQSVPRPCPSIPAIHNQKGTTP